MGFTQELGASAYEQPVHPHARGVYGHHIVSFPQEIRSIPTHVGFTSRSAPRPWCTAVHPHARGVYFLVKNAPPKQVRSIPTHVGFTSPSTMVFSSFSVHPHARGVYALMDSERLKLYGPSPRTWGLLVALSENGLHRRSIPTHVGFTIRPHRHYQIPSVHPHARGVYWSSNSASIPICGPSPRTWGLRPLHARHVALGRSIPTHVGFTQKSESDKDAFAVHPHARGVYVPDVHGSAFLLRSIPTHVGFTALPSRRRVWHFGPSPRTWGLPSACPGHKPSFRSIPTHVGFTLECHCRFSAISGPSPRTWGLH